VKRRVLLLLLEFVLLTVPLGWLWIKWGRLAYLDFFVKVSTPVFIALGVTELPVQLVIDHFINYVPFIVLIAITPELTIKRRIVGLVVGFVILFVCHIALTSLAFLAVSNYGQSQKAFSTIFPGLLVNDSMPFILWAVIAGSYLKRLIGKTSKKSVETKKSSTKKR